LKDVVPFTGEKLQVTDEVIESFGWESNLISWSSVPSGTEVLMAADWQQKGKAIPLQAWTCP